jgi:outer membrane protein assembly factor BamB
MNPDGIPNGTVHAAAMNEKVRRHRSSLLFVTLILTSAPFFINSKSDAMAINRPSSAINPHINLPCKQRNNGRQPFFPHHSASGQTLCFRIVGIEWDCREALTFFQEASAMRKWFLACLLSVLFFLALGPAIGLQSAAVSPWSCFRQNPQHQGVSAFTGPQTATEKWSLQTNGEVWANAVVGIDSAIYIGSANTNLYALTAKGSLRWSLSLGPIYGAVTLAPDGTIYVGADKLYAVNPGGNKKWEFITNAPIAAAPVVAENGTIYVSGGPTLYAILPAGNEAWRFSTAQAMGDVAFAPGGTIYVGSNTGILYALSAATGAQKWNVSVGSAISGSSPIVDAEGVIYLGTTGGKFLAVRPDGTAKWEFKIGSGTYSPGTLDSFGTLYFGANNGKIYALSAGEPSGPIVIPTFTTTFMVPIHPLFLSFPDVPSDYWAYKEIMSLVKIGVVDGYPDGTFKPEFPVTRAEFAKMIALALGLPAEVQIPQITFSDVSPQHWAFSFVEIAAKYNLVKGYPDGTFRPEGRITSAEVLTVIMRAKEYRLTAPPDGPPYILVVEPDGALRDLTSEDWFYQTVWLAVKNGVLLFPDNPHIAIPGREAGHFQFRFNSPSSRAQTAVFLARMPK